MATQPRTKRPAFSLVELLVVIAIALFLLGLAVAWLSPRRQAASSVEAINNLKQLALACHSAHDVFGHLPPIVGQINAAEGTLHFHLLRFIAMDPLWRKGDGAVWKNGVNEQRVPLFLDERDKSGGADARFENWLATTNFAANWLAFRTGENRIPASFPDGTSNTLLFAERYQVCNGTPTAWGYPALSTWTAMFGYYSQAKFQASPRQEDCDPTVPQSLDPAAMHVALCDGSARRVSASISPETWWYVTDPADGHILGRDWIE